MNTGRQRVCGSSANARKEKDEDLMLFREMFRRESQRNVSLLQNVSEEFDASQGNHPFYKFPSGKKMGHDFLIVESGKNDYDWLKTPPATPLFPSLELEANDPNMVIHKELPILEPLKPSRFSGKKEDPKPAPRSKSPVPVPSTKSTSSSRSVTPNPRPTTSSSSSSTAGCASSRTRTLNPQTHNPNPKPNNRSNIASRPEPANSKPAKPRSRGVSPTARGRLLGFTDEAPPNLITSAEGRASSATRGRPTAEERASSATRGRPAADAGGKPRQASAQRRGSSGEVGGRSVGVGSGVVVGSRMVEKLVNARRSAAGLGLSAGLVEREAKPKTTTDKLMQTPKASFDMAIKHMEERRSLSDARRQRITVNARSSTPTAKVMSSNSTPQTTPVQDMRNPGPRFGSESRTLIKKGETRTRCVFC